MAQPQQAPGTATTLHHNKRYIATHDSTGKSVYTEQKDQTFNLIPGLGGICRSYAIPSVPVVMKDDADLKAFWSNDGPSSHTKSDIVVVADS